MRAIPKMADYLDPDNDSDNAIFEARGKLIIALQQWAVEADLDIKKFISKYQTERRKNKQLQAEVEELKELLGRSIYSVQVNDRLYSEIKQALLNKEKNGNSD